MTLLRSFWGKRWLIKAPILAAVGLVVLIIVAAAVGGGGDEGDVPTGPDDEPTVAEAVPTATARPDPTPTQTTEPTATRAVPTETPTTTPTLAPADTPTPTVPPEPDGSSRDLALPIGSSAEIGGWVIVVNSVTPDGTDAVMAENRFNDPPETGKQFFIVNVSATYNGDDEPSRLFSDVSISALGPSSVAYQNFIDLCGVIPDELNNFVDVFKGGTITGNVCWSVLEEDVPMLLMFIEDDTSFDADDRFWWSLAP